MIQESSIKSLCDVHKSLRRAEPLLTASLSQTSQSISKLGFLGRTTRQKKLFAILIMIWVSTMRWSGVLANADCT